MTATVTVERIFLTPAEAAQAIGISRSKLYDLIARGRLPSVKVGSSTRIRVDALHAWARKQETA